MGYEIDYYFNNIIMLLQREDVNETEEALIQHATSQSNMRSIQI